jgi:hypothetical protein
MSIQYKIPEYVHVSQDCKNLLAGIFVANPAKVHFWLNSDQLQERFIVGLFFFQLHTENNNEGDQESPLVLEELT